MISLRSIHLVAGLASVALFVASGQYMHHVHAHLSGTPDTPRLLFRSAHIYLLMGALCNVALGLYLRMGTHRTGRVLQIAGSILLLLAPAAFAWSFFTESLAGDLERPMARWGAYLSLAGMALHLVASWTDSPSRRFRDTS